MRRLLRILISFCTVILSTNMLVYSQNLGGREVDVKIYFPYDQYEIDSSYMDNLNALSLVDSIFKDSSYISLLNRIEVTAQSSPEGRFGYNQNLSRQRLEALQSFFNTNYPYVDSTIWSFSSVAENWDLFCKYLEEDSKIPSREEVLSIVTGDRTLDDKEWLLKCLDGGKPWQYIKENILPKQRFGAKVLFIPIAVPLMLPKKELVSPVVFPPLPLPQDMPSSEPKLLFALRTNLLLDAASVVNIAAEVPIGSYWSVAGEVVYPWWQSWGNDFTMQIESYHGELKYWLGNRDVKEQLQGWSLGLSGGWGRYDIQPFSCTGVQGSFYDIGAQIGYSHGLGKHFHLEYTLGVGYLSSSYSDYKIVNDTDEYGNIKVIPYPWMNNKFSSIFPLRCGVALVWPIKIGGDKR